MSKRLLFIALFILTAASYAKADGANSTASQTIRLVINKSIKISLPGDHGNGHDDHGNGNGNGHEDHGNGNGNGHDGDEHRFSIQSNDNFMVFVSNGNAKEIPFTPVTNDKNAAQHTNANGLYSSAQGTEQTFAVNYKSSRKVNDIIYTATQP